MEEKCVEYLKKRFSAILASEKDGGENLFAGDGLTVQVFHLNKLTSLMERIDGPQPVEKHVIVYLVTKGKVEFRMGDELTTVSAGQSIRIRMKRNFSIWAIEDSDLFSIHNCVEPNVDSTPRELVDAVKKVELADAYLSGHNYRVGKYSTLLMQTIAPERSTPTYHMVAAYHDVGKVVVPSGILNKQGKLTAEEFAEIKKHPVASDSMLREIVGNKAAAFARWHHEKLDGSGYPDGLTGDQIPLESRVMAVADIFDALTTSRCYRGAFSFSKALEILESDVNAGKLDRTVFEALKRMVERGVLVEGVDNVLKSETAE